MSCLTVPAAKAELYLHQTRIRRALSAQSPPESRIRATLAVILCHCVSCKSARLPGAVAPSSHSHLTWQVPPPGSLWGISAHFVGESAHTAEPRDQKSCLGHLCRATCRGAVT